MKFKNRPNKCHQITDEDGTRTVWESRSVAVNGVIIITTKYLGPHVLVSKRGKNAADFFGFLNVVAGYLDWDETGKEAFFRETWEECGLDLEKLMRENEVLHVHINDPWQVKTDPSANRQNVSLRYGLSIFCSNEDDKLPALSLENNEVEDEVESCWWMPIDEIDNYKWAFKHDQVIKDFISYIKKYYPLDE